MMQTPAIHRADPAALAALRRRLSPRFSPRPGIPWRAVAIHGTLTLLWVALFCRGLLPSGLVSWAVGLVYIAYDTALLGFVFLRTLPLVRSEPAPHPAARRPTLAVVVAAHDEDEVLAATLQALLDQSDPPERILVADDGSGSATVSLLAQRFGVPVPSVGTESEPSSLCPRLAWLRLPHGGKAVALNRALLTLDEDVVVTVDADTLLDQDSIGALRRAFARDERLVAATGVLLPVCPPTLEGRLFEWFQTYEYVRNFLSRYAWASVDGLLLISGAFAGFRREAVMTVGGFDDDCLVEDYELIHRLRRYGDLNGLGWTTAVIGGARARTEAPGTLGAFLRQRRRWFGGFLQTQSWYREMIGDPRFGRLGTAMLPVKAADTLQPIFGLTAVAFALVDVVLGKSGTLLAISGVVAAKIVLDFAFHLWSVTLYRRWLGSRARTRYPAALVASLVEPFSFQILRNLGSTLGWVVFLTGRSSWGRQTRGGLAVSAGD